MAAAPPLLFRLQGDICRTSAATHAAGTVGDDNYDAALEAVNASRSSESAGGEADAVATWKGISELRRWRGRFFNRRPL